MPSRVVAGANHGLNTAASLVAGNAGSRYADALAGVTVIAGAARTGSHGFRITQSASNGSIRWNANAALPASQNRGVLNYWFKFPTSLPSNDCVVADMGLATTHPTLNFRNSDDAIILTDGTTTQVGPTGIVADTWYHAEIYTDSSANPTVTKWWIDGTSYTDLSTAQAATTFNGIYLGYTAAAQTMTCDYDDIVIWTDTAAITGAPFGKHKVLQLIPDTGSTTAEIGTANATARFTANGTLETTHNSANILTAISEVPPLIGATATGVYQRLAGVGNAVGVPMTSYTLGAGESFPGALRICVVGWAATATANNVELRSFNGTTETVLFAKADPAFDASTTTPAWLCKQVTDAQFDTQTEVDALVVRYGYSDDISPQPGAHAIYAEVAVKEAGGTSVAVGQPSTTDAAQPVTRQKQRTPTQPATTDNTIAPTRQKTKTVGQPANTDSVIAPTRSKSRTVGQPSTTDLAQPVLVRPLKVFISQAVEVDSAIAPARSKARTITQPATTDSAIAPARTKRRTMGQPTTADTATAPTRSKSKATGLPSTADLAITAGRLKLRSIGQPFTTDTARTVSVGGTLRVNVGQPFTVDSVIAPTRTKRKSLGLPSTADTVITPARRKSWTPVQPFTVDEVLTPARTKRKATGLPSTADLAVATTRRKARFLSQPFTVDQAQRVYHPILVHVGQPFTVDVALAVQNILAEVPELTGRLSEPRLGGSVGASWLSGHIPTPNLEGGL